MINATLMPTTDLSTLSGRVRDVSMFHGGASAQTSDHLSPSSAPAAAAPMYAAFAYAATTRTGATSVATNPWLGGFGLGDGTGICSTTVGESTKRIHPGRLEGVT